jgi:hypothetical protein
MDMSRPQTLLLLNWGDLGWQEFYGGVENIYEKNGISDVESEGGDLDNRGGIKYVYPDKTWKQEHFIYNPKPQ